MCLSVFLGVYFFGCGEGGTNVVRMKISSCGTADEAHFSVSIHCPQRSSARMVSNDVAKDGKPGACSAHN
jgi:hypothetical protein